MNQDWSMFRRNIGLLRNKINKHPKENVCPFELCDKEIEANDEIILQKCLHKFCRSCLVDEIHENQDKTVKVKCPICDTSLCYKELKDLLGDSHGAFLVNVMKTNEVCKATKAAIAAEIDDLAVIDNFDIFSCGLCYTTQGQRDGIILKNCHHTFCKGCLIRHVVSEIDLEIRCPFQDDNGRCVSTMQEREIRKLLPEDDFDSYLDRSLRNFQREKTNIFFCPTPDCKGFVEIEEETCIPGCNFECGVCIKVICVDCKAGHEGKSCKDFQDELKLNTAHIEAEKETKESVEALIAAGEAMNCPKCGILIQKDQGCDWIVCATCRLEICWPTQKPRHPYTKATGEVIDGCHCNRGGVRCHPKCGGCH